MPGVTWDSDPNTSTPGIPVVSRPNTRVGAINPLGSKRCDKVEKLIRIKNLREENPNTYWYFV